MRTALRVAVLACALHATAARAAAPAAPGLVDLLAKPLLAATMVAADEIWQPRLDELVQNAIVAVATGRRKP